MAAKAQTNYVPPVTGLYMSLGAGINILRDEHLDLGGQTSEARLRSRIGPAVVVALGYGFGNGLRVELEGNYRNNRFSQGRDFGFPAAAGGNEVKYGPMVNVVYDLTGLIPAVPYIAPYVGVGAGYQWVNFDNVHAYSAQGYPRFGSDDTRGAFAYQAIIGTVIPWQILPSLATTLEYRFMGTTDRTYDISTSAAPGTIAGGRQKFGNDFNHSILLGVRYNFGAPPAPPPAAPIPTTSPAPAPSRSYLVFFDWDKATLTDRARAIVKEAADNSTRVQYTRLEVNGYTDTSGTPQYNQGLSLRRARAVGAELVRNGVPQSAISIQGFGETNPLVPTGAGVREPQNRRVEIIIR